MKLDLSLVPGTWITGRVSDSQTGEGVRANVYYIPWPDNPHISSFPDFNTDILPALHDRFQSDDQGRYRLVGLPGRGLVEVRCGLNRPYPHGQGVEIADLPDRNAFVKIAGFGADQRLSDRDKTGSRR